LFDVVLLYYPCPPVTPTLFKGGALADLLRLAGYDVQPRECGTSLEEGLNESIGPRPTATNGRDAVMPHVPAHDVAHAVGVHVQALRVAPDVGSGENFRHYLRA